MTGRRHDRGPGSRVAGAGYARAGDLLGAGLTASRYFAGYEWLAGRVCGCGTSRTACWPPRHGDQRGADPPRGASLAPKGLSLPRPPRGSSGHGTDLARLLPSGTPVGECWLNPVHAPGNVVGHPRSIAGRPGQRAAAVRVPDRARMPEVAAVRVGGVADPRCAAGLSAAIVTCPAGPAGPAGVAGVAEMRAAARPSPCREVLP